MKRFFLFGVWIRFLVFFNGCMLFNGGFSEVVIEVEMSVDVDVVVGIVVEVDMEMFIGVNVDV